MHARLVSIAALCALLTAAGSSRAAPAASTATLLRQESRLQSAQRSLRRLDKDPKRRRFRDAWVSVLRELDSAVRIAPSGPRAAEVRLLAGRAREGLWSVSRSKVDGKAAVAAYRLVDEKSPGTATAARALLAAARLAERIGWRSERESVCKRLGARYADTAEQRAACPKAKEAVRPPAPVSLPSGKPVDPEADDDPPAAAPPPAPVTAAKIGAKAEARAARTAPPTPHREPDTDVPAEAARLMEELVQRTRAGEKLPPAEAEPTEAEAEALHEPEAPAAPPMRVAEVARAEPDEEDDPEAPAKARALSKAALVEEGPSLAAQLGLKVRTVVIDPGHGGKDTGAIGKRGVREKDVALVIARKLEKRLLAMGLVVKLTRRDDRFVSLDDRTRIANDARADLFVSIHCNAAKRRKLAGIETWTLNVGSSRYAKRLAAFENAESPVRQSDLRLILADLAKKANAGDARDLARSVQAALVRTVRTRVGKVQDHGVKQALFYVLLGTRMPSILVETAFLSNATEEARLKSAKYQEATAEAISVGVKEFMEGRQRLALAP